MLKELEISANREGQKDLIDWQQETNANVFTIDHDFKHTLQFYQKLHLEQELTDFGEKVAKELEPLVAENNLAQNLPYIDHYDAVGRMVEKVVHHPTYVQAGDIIYASELLKKMCQPEGLFDCLSLLFLSAQTGEAGHNCPIACSAGIIRVLQKTPAFREREFYLDKLTANSYQTNFTGAQFLTEIQGGSDVGLNATRAVREPSENDAADVLPVWKVYGEKWFCSNANADLIFLTARYDEKVAGTKGLALFLVPAKWNNKRNFYKIRRLKNKIGTRTMATGEIDFEGAFAYQIGNLKDGFHLVMDNVLHLSRLFNTICVLGMGRRAYGYAKFYAKHRSAFTHKIIRYPLVLETLARIKSENSAMLAAVFATIKLMDDVDLSPNQEMKLLLRLLINMQKYLSALWSVEHIHLAIGVLAGNGTIETFSPLPRLLRDCIVCENWEGAHNVLNMQVLKDINKYQVDTIFCDFLKQEIAPMNNKDLDQALQTLIDLLNEFKQLPDELQTLSIKEIVDRMVILFCATCIYKEAIHQMLTANNHSKMFCYQYFIDNHLSSKAVTKDTNYLHLVNNIVNPDVHESL